MAKPVISSQLHRIFTENVKARRKALGLTQADAAARLKISQPGYWEIENGSKTPGLDVVERVAKALEIEPNELLACSPAGAN